MKIGGVGSEMVVFGVLRAKKACFSRENARFNFSKSFVGRIEPDQNYVCCKHGGECGPRVGSGLLCGCGKTAKNGVFGVHRK